MANALTLLDLPLEAFELREHHCALDRVHASAHTDACMHIALRLTVHPNLAHRFSQRIAACEHCSAIAVTAERLGWEKTRAADCREVAAPATLVARSEALGGILDDRNPMLCRDRIYLVHVGWLTIKRHGHDCASARG